MPVDTDSQRLVAGRYQLLTPLGEGAMGTVWRARDELLGREVAVKEISFPSGVGEQDRVILRERTRREARAAAQLSHPSAVTVYDVVEEDGSPYLVMELVEAGTLAQLITTVGPLSPQRTAQIGLALLDALEAAHRQGVLHRDVKPSNVLVRPDGRVVLTDFGIATSTGDPSITHTGLLLGSPAYIAPERARGQAPGPPSDLWSLGATLYTAVEGRPPFDGDEPLLVVSAVVHGERAPYAAAGPLVPLLDGLLVKDPQQRWDAPAARRLLERVADSGPPPPAVAPAEPAVGSTTRTSLLSLRDVPQQVQAAPMAPALPAPVRARRPAWLVPALGVAGLLALGGGGAALVLADDPGRAVVGAREPAAPSAAAPSAAAPSAAAPSQTTPSAEVPVAPSAAAPSLEASRAPAAQPGAAAVQAGWSTDVGDAGWTVALPPGYASAGGGEYRQASTGRTLRVATGPGQPDAVADRERQARDFARRHPTYEQRQIAAVDYRGYEAADWEFTYEGLHVLNRVFVVDGLGHSLFFQTREADFGAARAEVDGILAAFRPAGG